MLIRRRAFVRGVVVSAPEFFTMPKRIFSTPAKKTVAKKALRKAAGKTAVTTTAKKKLAAKPAMVKRTRAKVLLENPRNLVIDAHDYDAASAIEKASAKAARATRSRRRTAVDMAADPSPGETTSASMVERVSNAIERELSKIERIVGNPARMLPAQRIETESRARVLASLARTLKEVIRLRDQERGAGDDAAKAADDDAIPRDLDEFRRVLSRRLEGLVAGAAALSAGGNEPD